MFTELAAKPKTSWPAEVYEHYKGFIIHTGSNDPYHVDEKDYVIYELVNICIDRMSASLNIGSNVVMHNSLQTIADKNDFLNPLRTISCSI